MNEHTRSLPELGGRESLWLLGVGVVCWMLGGAPELLFAAPSLAPTDARPEHEVVIHIQARRFQPERVPLAYGKKIRLVLRNHDAELHAFVPVGLLLNTTLQLSGNGAPQFGREGLVRVLLPSHGQTEILFIPARAGTFPFFCDLPGHVMKGAIVVQDPENMVQ